MRNALRYVAVRWRITDQPVLCAEKMRTHRAALPEKEVWTMTDLKCSVETCCFHDGDCCCRNDIMVGGAKACSCDETCCENFEQQKEGSARNADGYPDRMTQIDCEAVKCRYNTNYKCQAEHVDMRGSRLRRSPLLRSPFLLIERRSLRTFPQADFCASTKAAHEKYE